MTNNDVDIVGISKSLTFFSEYSSIAIYLSPNIIHDIVEEVALSEAAHGIKMFGDIVFFFFSFSKAANAKISACYTP